MSNNTIQSNTTTTIITITNNKQSDTSNRQHSIAFYESSSIKRSINSIKQKIKNLSKELIFHVKYSVNSNNSNNILPYLYYNTEVTEQYMYMVLIDINGIYHINMYVLIYIMLRLVVRNIISH